MAVWSTGPADFRRPLLQRYGRAGIVRGRDRGVSRGLEPPPGGRSWGAWSHFWPQHRAHRYAGHGCRASREVRGAAPVHLARGTHHRRGGLRFLVDASGGRRWGGRRRAAGRTGQCPGARGDPPLPVHAVHRPRGRVPRGVRGGVAVLPRERRGAEGRDAGGAGVGDAVAAVGHRCDGVGCGASDSPGGVPGHPGVPVNAPHSGVRRSRLCVRPWLAARHTGAGCRGAAVHGARRRAVARRGAPADGRRASARPGACLLPSGAGRHSGGRGGDLASGRRHAGRARVAAGAAGRRGHRMALCPDAGGCLDEGGLAGARPARRRRVHTDVPGRPVRGLVDRRRRARGVAAAGPRRRSAAAGADRLPRDAARVSAIRDPVGRA